MTSKEKARIISSMESRFCTKCQEQKPLEEFHRAAHLKSGRRPSCRQCDNALGRKRWTERIEERHRATKLSRERNRKKIAERKRLYQAGPGRAKMLAGSQRYYRNHPEAKLRRAERQKVYSKTERGKITGRLRVNRRRARLMGAEGKFTQEDWRVVLSNQKHRCLYCRKRFTQKRQPTIDHVIPLTKGGRHDAGNIVAACRPCNSAKWNRLTMLL